VSKALAEEVDMIVGLANLRQFAEEVQKVGDRMKQFETVADPVARQQYQQAMTAVTDICMNVLLDLAAEDLAAAGASSAAQRLNVARWTVDYGFQAFRFYTSWKHVDALNDQIAKDLNVRTFIKRERLEKVRPQINELEEQRRKLREVSRDDVGAMRKLISENAVAERQRKERFREIRHGP